jgi:hypothetical protein
MAGLVAILEGRAGHQALETISNRGRLKDSGVEPSPCANV